MPVATQNTKCKIADNTKRKIADNTFRDVDNEPALK